MSEYGKPSRSEDEYFVRQDLEKKKQWAKENAEKMATADREKQKQALTSIRDFNGYSLRRI